LYSLSLTEFSVKGEEAGERKWNMRESRKGNEKERGGESGSRRRRKGAERDYLQFFS
jgi:hypothetical protein